MGEGDGNEGPGLTRDVASERGVTFVDARFMTCVIKSGTDAGVTFST